MNIHSTHSGAAALLVVGLLLNSAPANAIPGNQHPSQHAAPSERWPNGKPRCLASTENGEQAQTFKANTDMDGVRGPCRLADGDKLTDEFLNDGTDAEGLKKQHDDVLGLRDRNMENMNSSGVSAKMNLNNLHLPAYRGAGTNAIDLGQLHDDARAMVLRDEIGSKLPAADTRGSPRNGSGNSGQPVANPAPAIPEPSTSAMLLAGLGLLLLWSRSPRKPAD